MSAPAAPPEPYRDPLDWWFQFTYREKRVGERNATTLGRTWHRVVGWSRLEAEVHSSRFERVAAHTLCNLPIRHLDYQRMVARPPSRGPLGGRVAVCKNCIRKGGGIPA